MWNLILGREANGNVRLWVCFYRNSLKFLDYANFIPGRHRASAREYRRRFRRARLEQRHLRSRVRRSARPHRVLRPLVSPRALPALPCALSHCVAGPPARNRPETWQLDISVNSPYSQPDAASPTLSRCGHCKALAPHVSSALLKIRLLAHRVHHSTRRPPRSSRTPPSNSPRSTVPSRSISAPPRAFRATRKSIPHHSASNPPADPSRTLGRSRSSGVVSRPITEDPERLTVSSATCESRLNSFLCSSLRRR